MTEQSNAAAERSAHVARGAFKRSGENFLVEVKPGIWQLKAVAEAEMEIEHLRAVLREARKALNYWGPVTGHGFSEKARIVALLDAALGEDGHD